MELKEFKEKVKEAVNTSLKLQLDYKTTSEDYNKKVIDGYLGKSFVDEKLEEKRKANATALTSVIRPLLEISQEVKTLELEQLEEQESEVTDITFNELKLLSEMTPNQELYQKYLDKYSNTPLAIEFIQDLVDKHNKANGTNLIILNLPKSRKEFLELYIGRLENYLMTADRPQYINFNSTLEMIYNGYIDMIDEDYQRYISM